MSSVIKQKRYQNQTFHYTRRIMPKRVTSLLCPTSGQHSYFNLRRCWSGGESFATLCKIWPVLDSKFKPPVHEARALTDRPLKR